MAVNLYQILPNMQVTREDMTKAEAFCQQYLQSMPEYKDLDLREGLAIRDLAIRPAATLIALLNKGVEYYFQNNTIADASNDTPEDMMDKILSNLFVTRKKGTLAVIVTRLYFAIQKPTVVPQSAAFSPDNKIRFFPVETISYPAEAMTFDPDSNEYYIDVLMQSETEGAKYNVSSGSLLYFSNFDQYFLRGEILFLKEVSTPKETNEEFIARAPFAISTRNLINDISIAHNLVENFSYVSKVKVVGYGHPEMIRDKKQIKAPSDEVYDTHLGGKVDIFCASDVETLLIQLTLDSQGRAKLFGPVFSVVRSAIPATSTPDTLAPEVSVTFTPDHFVNQTLTDWEQDIGFSSRHSWTVSAGSGAAGLTVSVVVRRFKFLDSIQAYLDNTLSRVVCGDLLARAYDCYLLNINLHSYDSVVPDKEIVQASVESYLRNLDPGEPFIMADFLDVLYTSGIKAIRTPPDVTYVLYRRGFVNQTGNIVDIEEPSNETSRFVLDNLVITNG